MKRLLFGFLGLCQEEPGTRTADAFFQLSGPPLGAENAQAANRESREGEVAGILRRPVNWRLPGAVLCCLSTR